MIVFPEDSGTLYRRERFFHALILAGFLHGVFIGALGFDWNESPRSAYSSAAREAISIDSKPAEEADDQAEYWAQHAQKGTGNTKDRSSPRSHLSNGTDARSDEGANALKNPERDHVSETVLASGGSGSPGREDVIAARRGLWQIPASQPLSGHQRPVFQVTFLPSPMTASDMNKISQQEVYAKEASDILLVRPNTKNLVYADYLAQWRQKVEAVGNLPASLSFLVQAGYGRITLEVTLNSDGTIAEMHVLNPEADPVLSVMAKRIVRKVAPFPPFGAQIKQEADQLRFAYEWRFIPNDGGGRLDVKAKY